MVTVKRIFKTCIICVLLALAIFVTSSFAGCFIETNHPVVRITVTFDGEDYKMEYKLYRNMYPQTVRHFIELADAGFYDNTIVHDYIKSDSWVTGGFSYNADAYADAISYERMSDYLEQYDLEESYNALFEQGKLTPSVYSNKEKDGGVSSEDALRSVMGEFSNNIGQEIENGALSASYGTLKMFYYPLETMQHVYVTPNKSQVIEALYKNNSATSLFMIQVSSTSSYSASNYATFGKIKDTDDLDDLLDAIDDYIDDNLDDEDDFTQDVADVELNLYDDYDTEFVDRGIETDFTATTTPIIIKSVKVVRY